jgi:hypothetical protein
VDASIEAPTQVRRGAARICAPEPGRELGPWLSGQAATVTQLLREHGALRFSGFAVDDAAQFETAVRSYTPTLLDYIAGGSARRHVEGRVYNSTEYSASQPIPLHCEGSYLPRMPRHIWFFCGVAPASGGRTPTGDMARVFERLDPRIVERFLSHGGVRYIHNLHDGAGFGRGWRDAFPGMDRDGVASWLTECGADFHWSESGMLHIEMVAPATRVHDVTGERVWINQAVNWHAAALAPAAAAALSKVYGSTAHFPKHATFADGTSIEDGDIHAIATVLREEESSFEWEHGDVLLCDNQRTSHGREPFTGARQILVALA